jgi:uncharacterized protein YbjT (DUF2867 family)
MRGNGSIGRPLIAELLAKGQALVALTHSPERAEALVEQGIEPAVADDLMMMRPKRSSVALSRKS